MLSGSLIFYVLALVSCIGAGYLLWSIVLHRLVSGTKATLYPSSIELGIVGLFALGIFSVLLNYFVPVSLWLSLFIITVCLLAGVVRLIRAPKSGLFKLLVFMAVIVLFAIWGSKFLLRVDSGVYHLQAISWMKDEPIVVGLANVHHRFGFNSLWLSALAYFWLPFYDIKGVLLANYLPSIFFVLVLINHLLATPKSARESLAISTVFALCCMVGFSAAPVLLMTNTTSTDLAANAFTVLAALIFLRSFGARQYPADKVNKDHMMLWIIAVFAALTKLSAITPGLLAVFYMLYHRDVLGIITIRRTLFFFAAVTGIWVLRNFILSGCLLFPVGLTCADPDFVSWSVGSGSADTARVVVERWARAPGPTFQTDGASTDWFGHWLQMPNRGTRLINIGSRVMGVLVIGLLYLLLLITLKKTKPDKGAISVRGPLTGVGLAMLAALTGLLFGFVTAPDPRFWWGSFIIVLMLPVSIVAYLLIQKGNLIGPRSIIVALLLTTIPISKYIMNRGVSWQAINHPMQTFRTVIPEAKVELVPATGFDIRMPVDDGMCWLAPKPCSPEDPAGLSRYRAGSYSVYVRETE
ncbi:MAG: hypothetical protein DRI24_21295 [Deltaproteobacteria bacterium]|nr:MAG: hypothetical protein DRI24_21295 [Deltaproteobacteria bacterium]